MQVQIVNFNRGDILKVRDNLFERNARESYKKYHL